MAAEVQALGAKYAVITDMSRYPYGDEATVRNLAARLNQAGEALTVEGVSLFYHNHNCELLRVNATQRAYDILLAETNPTAVTATSLLRVGPTPCVGCVRWDGA